MERLTIGERRNKILEILNENGRVYVNELSKLFDVSDVVIRQDLAELERKDMLSRVHGGAITSYKSYFDMSLLQRSNINAREKQAIAEKINEMIKDNDSVIMNAGTTPLFVMRAAAAKKITILTNSIALAIEAAKNPNFKLILLGGDVDSDYQFTYGTSAIKLLDEYTADLLVLSVDGIDSKKGISTFYHQEAELCRHMIEHARKCIVAADYSKIGRCAFTNIDKLSSVDTIVTNAKSPSSYLKKLRGTGIEVIAVP